ncbi:PREDICTED: methylsterol monooxygenase 1-1 [Theobroma cacao]|uniref:Methylsterol monooxygenase 1-1 n=1 Tax=Theobroma cacao TaxID=3641 RepID=A0AB32WHJ6_THECC|nr:PREDICTED: methylsterol monooxygenase 1-1 [Theobroma cacao]
MLPYQTLEEATLALGRNLTLAERLWYNYSAQKSDFLLYSHNALFMILVFSLVPLPCAFMELSQSKRMDKFKIQPNVKRTFSDMFNCYKYVMKMLAFVLGPLQFVSFPAIKWLGIHTSLPLPSLWEVLSQLLVYFLIEDYASYWFHRLLLHSKWGYHKIHYVHHEYRASFGFTALYTHWAEILVFGIPTFLGPAMVPCHMITLCLWTSLRLVEAIKAHNGFEFPWSPTKFIPFYVGAEYHDYHHYVGGQSQSNFASVFTYCDFIYGTNKGYRHRKQALEKITRKNPQNSKVNGVKSRRNQ